MRVKELIELLELMPQHKIVCIDQDDDSQDILDVEDYQDCVYIIPKFYFPW